VAMVFALITLFGPVACGGDDGDTLPAAAAADEGSEPSGESAGEDDVANGDEPLEVAGSPGGEGAGGQLMLGSEEISFDVGRCILVPQEDGTGGTIEINAVAEGVNAAGDPVAASITRYADDSQFVGDDIHVIVGEPGNLLAEYGDVFPLGTATTDSTGVHFDGELTDFDNPSSVIASIFILC
jgi:hypothetical protein